MALSPFRRFRPARELDSTKKARRSWSARSRTMAAWGRAFGLARPRLAVSNRQPNFLPHTWLSSRAFPSRRDRECGVPLGDGLAVPHDSGLFDYRTR